MQVETTININKDMDLKLSEAAARTGESKRNIISSLLRHLSEDYEKLAVPWKRISYQKRDPKKNWRRLHLTLMPDEYEFFLDLRKAYKMSVSRLVAYAMEKYFNEVECELINGSDNYRYKNYTLSCVIDKGVVCLIHYWGMAKTQLSRQFLNTLGDDAGTLSGT
jgi:hypothetical protein